LGRSLNFSRHDADIFRGCVRQRLGDKSKEGRMSLLRFSLVALALSASCFAAAAQGTPQQRAACRPDVAKFCKGLGDDPGVILECLEKNKEKISEKCQKVIEAK
jgi:hypothetical protein